MLHLFGNEPVTATALSDRHDKWMLGGASSENLADANVVHQTMATAPGQARAAAERLRAAWDGCELNLVGGNESDDMPEVVVIANARPCPGCGGADVACPCGRGTALACLRALGLKRQVAGQAVCGVEPESGGAGGLWALAEAERREFVGPGAGLLSCPEEDVGDAAAADMAKVRAAANVMASELTDGFWFDMDADRVVVAPVLVGGYKGRHIVGLLTSRVFT